MPACDYQAPPSVEMKMPNWYGGFPLGMRYDWYLSKEIPKLKEKFLMGVSLSDLRELLQVTDDLSDKRLIEKVIISVESRVVLDLGEDTNPALMLLHKLVEADVAQNEEDVVAFLEANYDVFREEYMQKDPVHGVDDLFKKIVSIYNYEARLDLMATFS